MAKTLCVGGAKVPDRTFEWDVDEDEICDQLELDYSRVTFRTELIACDADDEDSFTLEELVDSYLEEDDLAEVA